MDFADIYRVSNQPLRINLTCSDAVYKVDKVSKFTGGDVRILNRRQIEALSNFPDMVKAIEKSYIAVSKGAATIPPVGYLPLPKHNGDCHIKFGHLHEDPVFIVKIATGFYDNPKIGLPTSNGIMIALSAISGEVVAILQDEGYLTDLRTAIGAAIATRAMANKDASKVLVLGAGIQAKEQILAHQKLINDRAMTFEVWARDREKLEHFVADLKQSGCTVKPCIDIQAGCAIADIILTTTPSRTTLIQNEWIKAGTHITASGADAPGKGELDAKLVERADLRVADKIDQCLDHGEFAAAFASGLIDQSQCVELGNVLADARWGRQSKQQISIVDLTGLASQDIAAARTILLADGAI